MNSELKALLERLGPVQAARQSRSFSEHVEPVLLRRIGAFDRRIDTMRRLRASGLSLKAAHAAISELAEKDWTVCAIPIDGGITELADDLKGLDIALSRRRPFPDAAEFLTDVRNRHGLSQRELAMVLGFDVRTLQNWEQGRNRPDTSVLLLVAMFDRDPAAVTDALYDATRQPAAAE